MNLKVGDKVIIIAGKDKGKEGKIIAKKGEKVFVEGVNMVELLIRKPLFMFLTLWLLIQKQKNVPE